jgi:hypothetical protein
MRLEVILSVKFRAFGMTFGTYNPPPFELPLPEVPAILPSRTLLDVDERGIKLHISLLGGLK